MTNLSSMERPFEVTLLGWLFIVEGIASTARHLWKGTLDRWMLAIVLIGVVTVAAGVFLLRGCKKSSLAGSGLAGRSRCREVLSFLSDAMRRAVFGHRLCAAGANCINMHSDLLFSVALCDNRTKVRRKT